MLGEIAEQGDFEHLSLEGLDYQNQPDHRYGESDDRRDQPHQQRSKNRNQKQNDTGEFESDRKQNRRASQQQALDGMKAHKAILFIRLEDQEEDRRNEREVGQATYDPFRKHTDSPLSTRRGLHGSAATWAEGGRPGHLGSAVRTRGRGEARLIQSRLIHCRDHIKTGDGPQIGRNQSSALTRSGADSMFRANFDARQHSRFAAGADMASFCAGCGNSVTADDKFCRVCGRVVSADGAVSAPPGPPPLALSPAVTSGKAIVSLICGLFFLFFPASLVAVIFGHLSLSEIRQSAGRLKGDGLAIAGLVLGYAGLALVPILIIAAIAIPNLLRSRMAANESSAVASLRTLVVAETVYAQAHHETGYTCSLSDLDQLIDRELAGGRKYGYVFELTGCSAESNGGANVKYRVAAYPVTVNQTGVRAFCSDESAVIKVDSSGSATGCVENGSPLYSPFSISFQEETNVLFSMRGE